jgi:hypothetical protein
MSLVQTGYANPSTPSFEPNLPGSPVGPTGPVGPAGPAGATGPVGPAGPSATGPRIQSGTVSFATNGQTVAIPVPYSTSLQVFVQGTSNAAGVNGFFTVLTAGSLSEFRIFYSGQLDFGPIEMFWMTAGT